MTTRLRNKEVEKEIKKAEEVILKALQGLRKKTGRRLLTIAFDFDESKPDGDSLKDVTIVVEGTPLS